MNEIKQEPKPPVGTLRKEGEKPRPHRHPRMISESGREMTEKEKDEYFKNHPLSNDSFGIIQTIRTFRILIHT